jgi:phytoene dehydrogenase-like protein
MHATTIRPAARLDAIVVGGGHNGLVAAAYLARTGRRVLVLERRGELGGAAVSERAFAGQDARVSRYAYLVSLLPPRIAADLGVGVELRTRAVAAFAPTLRDGRPGGLLVERDARSPATAASFAALTGGKAEHSAFVAFGDLCARAGTALFPTFTEPLPSRAHARELIGEEAWRDLAERPLGETLAARFADGLVAGMVATDGLIGTFAALDDLSLRQNRCFLYHVVGGPWRVPVGGMGAVSAALEGAARRAGAELRTGAEVLAVDPAGEVTWREADGEHSAGADRILAGVAPATLDRLLGAPAGPAAEGCQLKVNLLLDRLPALRSGVAPDVAFAGTFRLHEDVAELENAHAQASRGEIPDRPPAELYCHTLTDPSIAPAGLHTLTLFGLHTPLSLFAADPDGTRDMLVERYLDGLDEHLAEPIRDCLARDSDGRPCLEARTPADLEEELALPGGGIFHGDLSWPWREDDDEGPAARWGVATAHERVLLCGAGARRGGGVSGVGGHNAAMAVLEL